jgi:hypothetical protein
LFSDNTQVWPFFKGQINKLKQSEGKDQDDEVSQTSGNKNTGRSNEGKLKEQYNGFLFKFGTL